MKKEKRARGDHVGTLTLAFVPGDTVAEKEINLSPCYTPIMIGLY